MDLVMRGRPPEQGFAALCVPPNVTPPGGRKSVHRGGSNFESKALWSFTGDSSRFVERSVPVFVRYFRDIELFVSYMHG